MKTTKSVVATAVSMAIAGPAMADPPANPDLPSVFCFRVTDMERVASDAEGDRFLVEFEVLNWTGTQAAGVQMSLAEGTSGGVTIGAGTSIDPDGRGGPTGGSDIGGGTFDPVAHQSGRGRGDIDGHLNDWNVLSQSDSSVIYSALDADANLVGTEVPFQNLLFDPDARVPGTGLDDLGDSAVDGGPGPYTPGPDDGNPLVAGAPPVLDGSGNVLDGFVIDIDGLGVGDSVAFNWFLLGTFGYGGPSAAEDGYGGIDCSADAPDCMYTIGTASGGNTFGFGTFALNRMDLGGPLADGLFEGNSGFNQNPVTFFGDVFNIPNPAEFGGEFGAGLTAPFLDPNDNVFGVGTNTTLAGVPEPATVGLTLAGLSAIYGVGWRRRRRTHGGLA